MDTAFRVLACLNVAVFAAFSVYMACRLVRGLLCKRDEDLAAKMARIIETAQAAPPPPEPEAAGPASPSPTGAT